MTAQQQAQQKWSILCVALRRFGTLNTLANIWNLNRSIHMQGGGSAI